MENVIDAPTYLILNGDLENVNVLMDIQCIMETVFLTHQETMIHLHAILELSLTISKENVYLVQMDV